MVSSAWFFVLCMLRILASDEPKNSKNEQLLNVLSNNFVKTLLYHFHLWVVDQKSIIQIFERWCINRIMNQNVQKVLIFGSSLASILKRKFKLKRIYLAYLLAHSSTDVYNICLLCVVVSMWFGSLLNNLV